MRWLSKNKDVHDPRYYRLLIRNIALIMIVVSIIPLLLIDGIAGYQFHTSYYEKVIDHLQEMAQKHKQNINRFLKDRMADIRVFARSYSFEELSDEYLLQKMLLILQEEHSGVFVDLGLVNNQGMQIAYAGPFKLGKANYADADWFKKAMQSQNFISDVFLGLRGLPHFIIAVKIKGMGEEWILRATIDFVAFNSLVENIQIGETGLAYIVNKEGEYQTKPRSEPALSKDYYVNFLSGKMSKGKMVVFKGSESETTYSSLRNRDEDKVMAIDKIVKSGKEYVCTMTTLKGGEWVLVYQQEDSDAFSELYRTRNLAIFILLVGSLAIALVAFTLSRKMVFYIAQADREKEMMNEQVIEAGKLASVGELAAGIAHEINNPVAIMVEEAGWLEDLLTEEDLKESENLGEFKRALKQIRTQGLRCKEITHKLLSFARKTDPNVHELQINQLVEEVVGLSEQRAKFSNVKIVTHFSEDLPSVSASPSEMQQVILNLINNAIDAMEKKGGTIEVTTRQGDNGNVIIDIGDNGPGIPRANLQRIFDPFFTTKPVGKGTGLGLSICYGIVKKMGGEITVNSAVDVGTTFHVHLPTAQSNQSENSLSDKSPSEDQETGN